MDRLYSGLGAEKLRLYHLRHAARPFVACRIRHLQSRLDRHTPGYSNPKIDDLLTKASVDMNYETRMRTYGEVQTIVWNEAPNSIVLFDQMQLIGTVKGLKGLTIHGSEMVKLDHVTKQ